MRNGDCGIKAWDKQFQNPPEQVIPIPRCVADAGKFGFNLVVTGGDEAWEHLEHRAAALAVGIRAKPGWKEALVVVGKAYRVERHNWEEVQS